MTRLPSLGPRGEGWLIIQALLMVVILAAGIYSGGLRGPLSGVAAAIGSVLLVLGTGLTLLAMRHLGSALSAFPRPRSGAPLVDRGIYRFARHPIYGGLVLISFGWAMVMASPSAVGLSLLLLLFFELKARREEAWLMEADPRYADYRLRTRRFVPWVY